MEDAQEDRVQEDVCDDGHAETAMILRSQAPFYPSGVMLEFLNKPLEVGPGFDRYAVRRMEDLRKFLGGLPPEVVDRTPSSHRKLSDRLIDVQGSSQVGSEFASALICHDINDIVSKFPHAAGRQSPNGKRATTFATAVESVNIAANKGYHSRLKDVLDKFSLEQIWGMDDRKIRMNDRDYLWIGAMMADLAIQRELDPNVEIDANEVEVLENMIEHFLSNLAARAITMPWDLEGSRENTGQWKEYRDKMDSGACDGRSVLANLKNASPTLIYRTFNFLWRNGYHVLLDEMVSLLYISEVLVDLHGPLFREWKEEFKDEPGGSMYTKIRKIPYVRKFMGRHHRILRVLDIRLDGDQRLLGYSPVPGEGELGVDESPGGDIRRAADDI